MTTPPLLCKEPPGQSPGQPEPNTPGGRPGSPGRPHRNPRTIGTDEPGSRARRWLEPTRASPTPGHPQPRQPGRGAAASQRNEPRSRPRRSGSTAGPVTPHSAIVGGLREGQGAAGTAGPARYVAAGAGRPRTAGPRPRDRRALQQQEGARRTAAGGPAAAPGRVTGRPGRVGPGGGRGEASGPARRPRPRRSAGQAAARPAAGSGPRPAVTCAAGRCCLVRAPEVQRRLPVPALAALRVGDGPEGSGALSRRLNLSWGAPLGQPQGGGRRGAARPWRAVPGPALAAAVAAPAAPRNGARASGRSQARARHGAAQRAAQGLSRDAAPDKAPRARARRLSRDVARGSGGSDARETWGEAGGAVTRFCALARALPGGRGGKVKGDPGPRTPGLVGSGRVPRPARRGLGPCAPPWS